MGSSVIQRELTVARKSESLQELRIFAREALARSKMSEYERGLVLLAVDEVITAIVENSANNNGAVIHLSVEISDVSVKITIEDTQTYYEFGDEKQYENMQANEQRREIDVYYLCQIMDEIYYSYNKGFENRVTMVKFLK